MALITESPGDRGGAQHQCAASAYTITFRGQNGGYVSLTTATSITFIFAYSLLGKSSTRGIQKSRADRSRMNKDWREPGSKGSKGQ